MRFLSCAAPLALLLPLAACHGGSSTDLVDTSSRRGSDQATIVLNGRRQQCDPYEVARGSPTASVPNFVAASGCKSEAAVFATMNAMSLVDTRSVWTNGHDTAYVPMREPYVVPLNIYAMSGDLVDRDINMRIAEATDDVTEASRAWDVSQCGITFAIKYIGDASDGSYDPSLLKTPCTDAVAAFRAVDTHHGVPDAVNVYFYEGVPDTQGQMCRDGATAVIVVSKWAGIEVLAHELGHALSLDHTNGNLLVPSDDVMMSPASAPAQLTVGQCFRANVNDSSVLHTLQIRNDTPRQCPDNSPLTDTCPTLETHR